MATGVPGQGHGWVMEVVVVDAGLGAPLGAKAARSGCKWSPGLPQPDAHGSLANVARGGRHRGHQSSRPSRHAPAARIRLSAIVRFPAPSRLFTVSSTGVA